MPARVNAGAGAGGAAGWAARGAPLTAGFWTAGCGQRRMPPLRFPFQSSRPRKPAKDRQAGPSQPRYRMGKVSCSAVACRGPSWLRAGREQRPPPVARCPSVKHPDSPAPRGRPPGTLSWCRLWPNPIPEVPQGSHQPGCPKASPLPPRFLAQFLCRHGRCRIQARWHRCAVVRAVTSRGKRRPSHHVLSPSR